jgi:hypothetical protein
VESEGVCLGEASPENSQLEAGRRAQCYCFAKCHVIMRISDKIWKICFARLAEREREKEGGRETMRRPGMVC